MLWAVSVFLIDLKIRSNENIQKHDHNTHKKHPKLHINKFKPLIAIPHQPIVQSADVWLVAHAQSFDNPSFQEHLKMVLDASNRKLLRGKVNYVRSMEKCKELKLGSVVWSSKKRCTVAELFVSNAGQKISWSRTQIPYLPQLKRQRS